MATATMHPAFSPRHTPLKSSPLAAAAASKKASAAQSPLAGPQHTRAHSFPHSRALRPFASISTSLNPSAAGKKPVKLIQPPEGFKAVFVLNLTQEEFSRRDCD